VLVLGRYELLEQLGAGSMGAVYRARDVVLDREVAVKTMRVGSYVEPEIRERFFREAKACARFQHPNIITVYDMGEGEGVAYMAMELLVGVDWRKLIDEGPLLTLDAKLDLMVQACDGLEHAHSHGIIHRDLKPSNLFYVENQRRVKILDFGIARMPSSRLTIAGKVLGTVNYMAPEQIGRQPCDARSDLFCIAIVFFELLTGRHPFQATFVPRRIVDDEPDSLSTPGAEVPAALEAAIFHALRKNPNERYQTAAEFATELRRIREEIRATGTSAIRPAVKTKNSTISKEGPTVIITPVGEPGPDDDPADWRLAEMLRLMRDFDDYLEQGKVSGARKIVVEMRKIATTDARFQTALQEYEGRLPAAPAPTPAPMVAPPPATAPKPEDAPTAEIPPEPAPEIAADPAAEASLSKPCATCGAGNASSSMFCWRCGSKLERQRTTEQSAVSRPPTLFGEAQYRVPTDDALGQAGTAQPAEPRIPDPEPPPPKPKLEPSPSPERSATDSPRRKVRIVAGGALVCVLVITAGLLWYYLAQPGSAPEGPAQAVAVVASPRAWIHAAPVSDDRKRTQLSSGDRIDVLRLPQRRTQTWIAVRKAGDSAGYVRASDLKDWEGLNAPSAFQLLTLYAPDAGAPMDQVRAYAEKLREFARKYPNAAEKDEAQRILGNLNR
jgi:serine/threonine protein kinase